MESREIVRAALTGGRPERIPFALGFFSQSLFGAPDGDELFGTDVRFVEFDPPADQGAFQTYLESLPADVHVGSTAQLHTYQEWGYRPESGEPHPLSRAVSAGDISEGMLPDLTDARRSAGLREEVERLHRRGLAAAGAPPALGGELFESAYRLRGFERFMEDLLERPALVHYLLDQLTAMLIRNAVTLAEAGVDILLLDDDVAASHGLIVGPHTWRRFFRDRMASVIAAAREAAPGIIVFFHSDGDISRLLPELVEVGVDVVNPLAPDCMDSAAVRREFGGRLAFWGTVGTAVLWDQGTPDQVRAEVRLRKDALGPSGLLLSPAYDIDYAPRENVLAFVEAALEP
ncbi:MAG: uroporphyrinogen decarboxylase family protein [Thermoleophilia bacterium]